MTLPLRVGRTESVERVFTQTDFDRFAALSGDDNPIHVDPEFSARTKFGRPVAHGMFLYSVVCSVLGARLPGPGTVQREQELMFPSPTYAGEEVTVQVEVTKLSRSQSLAVDCQIHRQTAGSPDPAGANCDVLKLTEGLADLNTFVIRPNGDVGLQGRTLVRLPGAIDLGGFEEPPKSEYEVAADVSLKGLEIGQWAETRRSFTAQDLAEYADLTGDSNPIFADASYAQQMGLVGPMIPGGLLGGLFSRLLGSDLPGRGTNYLKQRLEFPTPAYPGQELTARVEVIRIRPEKQLVNLSTVCTNPAGEVVCHGEALVLVSDMESKT